MLGPFCSVLYYLQAYAASDDLSVMQGSMILSLRYLVATIVALTGFMMLAKAYVDKNICVPIQRQGSKNLKPKSKKKKGSLKDSLEVLRSSPMILNLALLVISYGVSHRLFEFAWKGQLRALYPSAQAYQVFVHSFLDWSSYFSRLLCRASVKT